MRVDDGRAVRVGAAVAVVDALVGHRAGDFALVLAAGTLTVSARRVVAELARDRAVGVGAAGLATDANLYAAVRGALLFTGRTLAGATHGRASLALELAVSRYAAGANRNADVGLEAE
jgi:hypothetical protein